MTLNVEIIALRSTVCINQEPKMSDQSEAWVWSQYKGVIAQNTAEQPKKISESFDDDRVVPIRLLKDPYTSPSTPVNRTKYGILIAAAVLVGLFYPWISIFFLVLAALLIASGLKHKQTEEFLASLPGGTLVNGFLSQLDKLLS